MSDVVPDAAPEDYQEDDDIRRPEASSQPSPENQENDEGQMLFKLKSLDVSGERKNERRQSDEPTKDFYDDDYTEYNDWFPPHLRKKLNIAIIHAGEEKEEANDMRVYIERNVHLMIKGKCFRPRVDLLEHVTSDIKNDPLDVALNEADYLFLYVTQNFTQCEWSKYQGRSGVRDIVSGSKVCSMICVHTDQSSGDNLPAVLKNLQRLYYYQEKHKFVENIIELFKKIRHKLLNDKDELTKNRKLYYDEKSPNWSVNPESSSNRSSKSHQKTNPTETGNFSQHQSTRKQTSPAVAHCSGAVGNGGSRKPIYPQPIYPKDKKVSHDASQNY